MSWDSSIGVLAVVPDNWNGITYGRHQVLSRLANRFNVLWLEPALGWRDLLLPNGAKFLARDQVSSPLRNLEVFDPGFRHPLFYAPLALANWTARSRLRAARERLIAAGAKRIVLYIWRDEFAPLLDLVEHDISVYHIDDEYSFDERDPPNSASELELLTRADQVIIHSMQLMKKKGGINPHTELIPNGVDFDSYANPREVPPDLARVPAPRIGYSGVIKWQLDFELLRRLALARPNYSFVMVGPIRTMTGKEKHLRELQQLPNVHFLGNKAPNALPAYTQNFDVCLMCYETNNYTKYIYPLKLHEYLATGKPTVSAPLDAVQEFSSVVTIAQDEAQWLTAVDSGLSANSLVADKVAARRAVARAHDWEVIVDRVAATFRAALARTRSS